jgi:hypothetical protein
MRPSQHGSGGPRPGSSPDRSENQKIPSAKLSDRDLHDRVITYLTDAKVRVDSSTEFLNDTEAKHAQRFSRFLARRYYRDRLQRGFRYSTSLVSQARAASQLVDRPEFNEILNHCILGSSETARKVGHLAVTHSSPLRDEAWWPQLLEYEAAFFLQLAISEPTPAGEAMRVCVSTVLRRFTIRIPELLECIRSGRPLPPDLQGSTTLLFSRTVHGRIYAAEVDPKTEATFMEISRGADLRRGLSADAPGMPELEQILTALQEIGAISIPSS